MHIGTLYHSDTHSDELRQLLAGGEGDLEVSTTALCGHDRPTTHPCMAAARG